MHYMLPIFKRLGVFLYKIHFKGAITFVTYFDEVGCVSEGQLEGAVPRGEAEGAGLVVTLQVVVHRIGHHVHEAQGQHQDSTCNK